MEWLLAGLPALAVVTILSTNAVLARRKRPAIAPEIREEIEQTPDWWDREFRRLSGIPEPVTPATSTVNWGLWSPRENQPYRFADFVAPTAAEIVPPSSEAWGRAVEYRLTELQEGRDGREADGA